MQVSQCMSRNVEVVDPDTSLREAARKMAQIDAGVLPVGENDRLVGMITDRDIAVRGVAKGLGPDAAVRDVMTGDVVCCYDDQDIQQVAGEMSERQVRRMPVLGRGDDRLVGIVSLADITRSEQQQAASMALDGISQPGGEHNQSRQDQSAFNLA